nr:MAG TPA: hypothetical protein [Caudoviricetes sp.]
MNNKRYFSMARAVELQDEAKTLEEAKTRFERSCSICPKAGFCIEEKCYLAQLHTAKMTLLEAEELRKTTKVVTEIRKTRKYNRKGVAQRLLTNAAKRVVAYSQELAIDDASVFVELGDYESAYRVLKRNGLDDEAEALKNAIKGGD